MKIGTFLFATLNKNTEIYSATQQKKRINDLVEAKTNVQLCSSQVDEGKSDNFLGENFLSENFF